MVRNNNLSNAEYCADLVITAVKNGADGFMFTVNDKALAILGAMPNSGMLLYPLIPDASGLVRKAGGKGGVLGLAKGLAGDIIGSGGMAMMADGVRGIVANDPKALLRAYLRYEIGRLKSATGGKMTLGSMLLHEILTDMALALGMRWLFEEYVRFMTEQGIKAGFETRNFPCLVNRFEKWGLDLNGLVVAAPFNKVGFQMCPSAKENKSALTKADGAEVIAFSVLAAGRIKIRDAVKYVGGLPHITGVAIGVSNKKQAKETFGFFAEVLG